MSRSTISAFQLFEMFPDEESARFTIRWAVSHHSRGAHDEGGVVIHATPRSKRIQYAKRIASIKGERRGEVPF